MKASNDIVFELAFPADYDVSVVSELPGRPRPLHAVSRTGRVADGGVIVEVTSARAQWMGLIANAPETLAAGCRSGRERRRLATELEALVQFGCRALRLGRR